MWGPSRSEGLTWVVNRPKSVWQPGYEHNLGICRFCPVARAIGRCSIWLCKCSRTCCNICQLPSLNKTVSLLHTPRSGNCAMSARFSKQPAEGHPSRICDLRWRWLEIRCDIWSYKIISIESPSKHWVICLSRQLRPVLLTHWAEPSELVPLVVLFDLQTMRLKS